MKNSVEKNVITVSQIGNGLSNMTSESVQEILKRNNPGYSDKIDDMMSIAQRIIDSKNPLESMNTEVQMLDAMDAYVLGMITGEFIKNGTLHIEGLQTNICKDEKMKENTTSEKMVKDIGSLVQSHIEKMKENNQMPTRDDVINAIADRLGKILESSSEKSEIAWIVSGVTTGIAIVLQIEHELNAKEQLDNKSTP